MCIVVLFIIQKSTLLIVSLIAWLRSRLGLVVTLSLRQYFDTMIVATINKKVARFGIFTG